jgi:hypothetical protein
MNWDLDVRRLPTPSCPYPLLSDLQAKGIDLYLHQQGIDITTPGGKAMFHLLVSTDPAGKESREELKTVGGAYR